MTRSINNMKQQYDQRIIEWVSSLRGIAALLVFISHLYLISGSKCGFIIGRVGVVIFFLITGYLSVGSRNKRNRKQYIFNRFVRMYPIYWLLLALYCMVNCIVPIRCISLKDFLLNMTLFNEFLGSDCILSPSWMMPIQILFFMAVGIWGISFLEKDIQIGKKIIAQKDLIIFVVMILAIVMGILRKHTELPFPVAMFLLLGVSQIGMQSKLYTGGGIMPALVIFEIGLIITTFFAYSEEWIIYVIAYNAGLAIYFLAKNRKSFSVRWADNLGKVGFSFFLGADIPVIILSNFFDFTSGMLMILTGYVFKFISAVLLAFVITEYLEKPLLIYAKYIEIKV